MEDKQMQQLLDKLDELDHKLDVIDSMVGCMDELSARPRLAQDLPMTCPWIPCEEKLPENNVPAGCRYPNRRR